jgi:hypothetical protein
MSVSVPPFPASNAVGIPLAEATPEPLRPVPAVAWQVTGNHWLALPCVHPDTGAVHAVGVVHRGSRSAVEFAGGPGFVDGVGPALITPVIRVDGATLAPAQGAVRWERANGWVPAFAWTAGSLVVRGTVLAPYGKDVDMPGMVYAITIENLGAVDVRIEVALEGVLGYRQQRVRTGRPYEDGHRVLRTANGVVLEGTALPGVAALYLTADGPADVESTGGVAPTFALRRAIVVPPGASGDVAFFLAAGPERDGAEATGAAMRRHGWRALAQATSEALGGLEQSTGSEGIDRLVNRNVLFAYFYGVGRALDDAHYYLVRSRAPWNGRGLTVRDWDALTFIIPAVQLADPPLARELLLRACELHGYAPGRGVNYLDGTLFEPGFSLEGAAAYALAVERYIRETGDDQVVEEPVLADTLYASADDIAARRDKSTPLYATEVTASGALAPLPYTLHANAVVAMALDVFQRTLDAEAAKGIEDPSAVRAAMIRQFAIERDGKPSLASAIDLQGGTSREDDPVASALWLPLYDAVDRQDSLFRRTVKGVATDRSSLVRQLARLVGPDAAGVLAWLRRAPLDGGIAAEVVDDSGRAVANGGDAALAGLLAYTVWYAVHALGLRP